MKDLQIVPCSVQDAKEYVRQVHRTHEPPVSGLFACAVARPVTNEELDDLGPFETLTGGHVKHAVMESLVICGVAIVGRPNARELQDGFTADVTRVATDGTKNACSILYAACWRAARALGYRRLGTYVLADEPGTSLKAAGWKCLYRVKGRSWHTPSRPRVDRHPTQDKFRWEVSA